jgi:transcriptional regulator with XRE-family HTH domain
MMLYELLTNDAVLAELGRRLERQRLSRNLTQDQMAEEAGIGRATLQRLERGQSVQTTSLIKLLRALELLQSLDVALPEVLERPIAQLEDERRRKPRQRARARGRGRAKSTEGPWRWGDEPEATA